MAVANFLPILFAGGRGGGMPDLTSYIPKCLLPVCNQSMLIRSVRYLINAGFNEAIVFVPDRCSRDVRSQLAPFSYTINLRLKIVPDNVDEDWGTVDSLMSVKDELNAANVILLSCDLITDFPMAKLLDFHSTKRAALTCLLTSGSPTESIAPGPKAKRSKTRDVVAIESSTNRLLHFYSEAELDEPLELSKNLFIRYRRISVSSKLTDAHLYVIKTSALNDILSNNKFLTSVKLDVIPLLIKHQLTEAIVDISKSHGNWDCYAVIPPSTDFSICVRCNQLSSYFETNKQFHNFTQLYVGSEEAGHSASVPKVGAQVGGDCVLGADTVLGDRAMLKRSVVGKHCKIGSGAKVVNCLLMDYVTIADGAVLNNSIVLHSGEVGDKAELKDSIVGCNQKVEPNAKQVNKVLSDVKESVMEM